MSYSSKRGVLAAKIDVLQSRPSAGGHKILNFTSKILDFLTTGYLPFSDFFTFSQRYSYVFWIQYDYVFSNIQLCFVNCIRSRCLEGITIFREFNVITFFRKYIYVSWIQCDYVFSKVQLYFVNSPLKNSYVS